MTKILPIRLNEKEFQMLDEILSSENCESENRSEWIRLLIHREWNKRKGLGVPAAESFQSAFRVGGRPSWNARQKQLRKLRLTGVCNTDKCRHEDKSSVSQFIGQAVTRPALLISRWIPESKGASRADRLHKAAGREISARRPRSKRTVKHSGK